MSIYTKVADDGGKWVEIGASSGSGELPGLGGWATITEVTGTYTPHRYNDGVTDWVAYEFTDNGTITTSEGLVDLLVVGAGGLAPAGWVSGSGGGMVFHGVAKLSGDHDIAVGKPASTYASQSRITESASKDLIVTCPCGQQTAATGPYGYTGVGGTTAGAAGAGAGAGGNASSASQGGPGVKVAIKSAALVEYGRGGDAGSGVGPANTGQGGQNGKAANGVVIFRVPKAYADNVQETFHSWESFALVTDGVVTEVTRVPDNEPRTLDTEWVPCSADVQVGWVLVEGEFVTTIGAV